MGHLDQWAEAVNGVLERALNVGHGVPQESLGGKSDVVSEIRSRLPFVTVSGGLRLCLRRDRSATPTLCFTWRACARAEPRLVRAVGGFFSGRMKSAWSVTWAQSAGGPERPEARERSEIVAGGARTRERRDRDPPADNGHRRSAVLGGGRSPGARSARVAAVGVSGPVGERAT